MSNALTTLYVQFSDGPTRTVNNLTEDKAGRAYNLVAAMAEEHHEFAAGQVMCVSYEVNDVMRQWDRRQGHIVVDWAEELSEHCFGDDA